MNNTIKRAVLIPFNILYKLSPKLTIKILFRLKCGYNLNLSNPSTYNEKLNWLKLYYRNALMPLCADKLSAREYIISKGFGKYLPKLLWNGHEPDLIPYDSLPDSFIIKSTSGSGNNIIVKDKNSVDKNSIKKQIRKWLKEDYLPAYGEWHYANIIPSIIIEELLSDRHNFVPIDYKFMCFNNIDGGDSVRVGCICVDIGRYINHHRLVFDRNWNYMPNVKLGFDNSSDEIIPKPKYFEEMCQIAVELAQPFPHCRVDFFVINEKFYIGEITFFNGAGFDLVVPTSMNKKMGEWIKLPDKNI